MRSLWVAIDARPPAARLLAMAGPTETLLKARLATTPRHPRALATLLEGLALWEGVPVRAALAVGDEDRESGMDPFHVGLLEGSQSPLYALELVARGRRPRPRDGLSGLGDFRDLRQLCLFEVAR